MKEAERKIILVALWGLMGGIFAAGVLWLYFYFIQFSPYHNSQFHFSLRYPSFWKKMEGFQGTAVTFVRPKESALELFQPNVNITVQEVPDQIATLGSFSKTITKQMTVVFKKHINILEDKDCTFADWHGHRLILEAPKPDSLKAMFVWTIKGSFAYIFTFMARTEQYKKLILTVDEMVKSFKLK